MLIESLSKEITVTQKKTHTENEVTKGETKSNEPDCITSDWNHCIGYSEKGFATPTVS